MYLHKSTYYVGAYKTYINFIYILLQITAFENYLRLCTPQNNGSWFNKTNTTVILLFIWCVGSISSALQYVYKNFSFDYCDRTSDHKVQYEARIVGLLILIPLLITFLIHIRIIVSVRHKMNSPNYKPSLAYTWDLSLVRTNFYSFLIFVLFWLPFSIILVYGSTQSVTNRVFYNTAWLGLSKSCFHNFIYCLTNRNFQSAYISLFHYCW